MAHLSVRTQKMPSGNAFASPVVFDFSGDIGQGEQILAFAVALSGFLVNYETNSSFWAESVGAVGASLTPNLFGDTVVLGGNVMLTDYQGDTARCFWDGESDPASVVQATALAVIGTSVTTAVCGTTFGLQSGADSPPIDVPDGAQNLAFLSGFSVASATGGRGYIGGLTLSSGVSSPLNDQVQVNGTTALTDFQSDGTVDIGLLSYLPDLTGFDVARTVDVNWSAPDKENGMTGTFQATFTIPDGYSQIVNAAILLQDVTIVYGDTTTLELIGAMQSSDLTISGAQVSGSFILNIYNPDWGARTYITSDSTATLAVIAQFA
ncbi:hypothetical protein [Nonomuraea sp. NPDC052265]|uniref:hypothetical protein n=1 Tax=Nonomuraea sp. NPDC052265 TaxID=3364374 RepID=UPI0037C93B2F